MTEQSIALYNTKGSSDKVYQVQLKPEGDGWVVEFQNGRRGGNLRSGRKTTAPVDYASALEVYTKLVESKKDGGYTPDESGVAYVGTDKEGRVTGYDPQLLNSVSLERLLELADTGEWLIQTKHDGERRGISHTPDGAEYSNRKGLRVPVQESVANDVDLLSACHFAPLSLDCEDMGDHVIVFDVTDFEGKSIANRSFEERTAALTLVRSAILDSDIMSIKVDMPREAPRGADMIAYLDERRAARDEGIVMKRKTSVYAPGRPSREGDAIKYKFVERATVRVQAASKTKRSVSLEVLDNGQWTGVGNCTVPANQDIPKKGALIDVEYLYAYPGGSLFQPVLIGQRSDLEVSAATISQLKMKT